MIEIDQQKEKFENGADSISPTPAFLELRGLSRSFGNTIAVQDMSLSIKYGEYITLLGPSGCGKTTTLKMIAGFLPPQKGEVWLENENITSLPPEKRPVNTVFQDYALFPHLTLRQNVEYGLRFRQISKTERKRRAMEMLERVELQNLSERYPRFLSGGQQQRVALARALVCQPRLLLLDEPLGALDARLREQMQLVLKDLQRSLNITFIHVTHDQMEAMALSDRIVVMCQGVIQQEGTPDELYFQPTNSFVADFLGITNLFEGNVLLHGGANVVADVEGLRFISLTRGQPEIGQKIFIAIRPSAINLIKEQGSFSNCFNGVVVALIYRGDQYLVKIQAGQVNFLVLIPAEIQQETGIQVGKKVMFTWSPEDAWIMKD